VTGVQGNTLTSIGTVAAPWAFDAQGRAVATEYIVRGGSLVQVVTPDAETVYPIVADPSVRLDGLKIIVTFNSAETANIARQGLTPARFGTLVCLAIPNAVAAAACALIGDTQIDSIEATFKTAASKNGRVELIFRGAVLEGWRPVR
jgi:hypothetical protein